MITRIKEIIQGRVPLDKRRSSKWPRLRKEFLSQNKECAACGGIKKLEVHHIVPFHVNPSLELEASNLITLCESKRFGINCHLFFGHTGVWRRVNPDVIWDAAYWKKKLSSEISSLSDSLKRQA